MMPRVRIRLRGVTMEQAWRLGLMEISTALEAVARVIAARGGAGKKTREAGRRVCDRRS